MIVIGLNNGEFNSSATIVRDGEVLAGAPEERFIREKMTKLFPHGAIKYCLETANISLEDCDYIAQAWNPGIAWEKYNPLISKHRRERELFYYTVPDNLFNQTENRNPGDWTCLSQSDDKLPPIYFIRHHLCHAANAYFLSGFEESAILTCDFRGEFDCATFGKAVGNKINVLQSQQIPHSLGMFYATYTELLGYKPDNDEWKVMALSSFDVNCKEELSKIRQTYALEECGKLVLDQSFYKGAILDQPNLYTQKLIDLLGGRLGKKGEEFDEWHCKVAKAMQTAAEEIATHFLNHLYEITKCENLVLSGGFFMNSVFNGKIHEYTQFKNIFIPYAPSDAGNSIGAALYLNYCILGHDRNQINNSSYIGPEFSSDEIKSALERRHISYLTSNTIGEDVAKYINDGKIVALFNGRMEFGDRALGNRSIIADPRDSKVKDKINSIIKYRESYRPFAPVVLKEFVEEIFEVSSGFECNYMEKVVPIRKNWQTKLGAVTHIDGSGRVQTVSSSSNKNLYDVVQSFYELSGVPVILNTSFNINGEPIVLSPDDALNTFFNSGLDILVMNNFIVEKK